jgi:hypothetical protein
MLKGTVNPIGPSGECRRLMSLNHQELPPTQ